jgi:hypothetical protein
LSKNSENFDIGFQKINMRSRSFLLGDFLRQLHLILLNLKKK